MLSRFVAFTSLGRKALPNQYDLFAFALIFSAFIAVTHVSHGVTLPLTAPESTVVSLDYLLLPYYALRTTLRMFAAIAASLLFTFVYATLRQKPARRARPHPVARCSAIGADLGFSVVHGDLLSRAFPRLNPGRRMRGGLSRFSPHKPGTWPFLLSVAPQRAARSGRSRAWFWSLVVAAVLAA